MAAQAWAPRIGVKPRDVLRPSLCEEPRGVQYTRIKNCITLMGETAVVADAVPQPFATRDLHQEIEKA